MSDEAKAKLRAANLGEKSPVWKGGTHLNRDGYRKNTQKDHPKADRQGYVYEHVLVAEKCLGRYLDGRECIHHINESKADNRRENLYVFPTRGAHAAYHVRVSAGKVSAITATNLPEPTR